jgi:hypothetical protein
MAGNFSFERVYDSGLYSATYQAALTNSGSAFSKEVSGFPAKSWLTQLSSSWQFGIFINCLLEQLLTSHGCRLALGYVIYSLQRRR